jgi:hypothetical protein
MGAFFNANGGAGRYAFQADNSLPQYRFTGGSLTVQGIMTRSAFLRAIEEILDVPARGLRDEDNRETIANWTSLVDTQIFSLISSEFGIEPDSSLIEAETVNELLILLQNKGAFRE